MNTYYALVWIWIGIALFTFLILVVFKIRAPYGRHTTSRWGKMIDNHWGWFWMAMIWKRSSISGGKAWLIISNP